MKKIILTALLCFALISPSYAKGYHYSSGNYSSKTYYSTRYPKHRSVSARNEFLRKNGYGTHTPKGYQVDHIIPLSEGGADTPSNMQLLTIPQHQAKTSSEHRKYNW